MNMNMNVVDPNIIEQLKTCQAELEYVQRVNTELQDKSSSLLEDKEMLELRVTKLSNE